MSVGKRTGECRWPELSPRYDAALREAVDYIINRYAPWGIVAAGSTLRGAPDATSDLDLYVIHGEPWRQRVQKLFGDGVPAEIFVNPPASVRRFFKDEHASGRPITAHMLATGWVVLSRHEMVETLRREAAEWLARAVEYPPFMAVMNRYHAATLYEDARDVAAKDPAGAGMMLHEAVMMMLRHWFLAQGLFVPRSKELVSRIAALDEGLGDAVAAFFTAPLAERWERAKVIADRTIQADGFFEWEAGPAPVPDAHG